MKISIYAALLIIPGLTLVACSNQDSAGQGSESGEASGVESAKELFKTRCAACHGNNGKGGMSNVPDLQASGADSITIFHTIQNGKGSMPSFKTVITENEIKHLTDYVYHLKTNRK